LLTRSVQCTTVSAISCAGEKEGLCMLAKS
jgi:hypothetical protein